MKLKPIHIILIVLLLVEAIVLGVVLGKNHSSNTQPANKQTELLVTYEANKDGSYNLLSIFDAAEEPKITFTYNDTAYTFDHPLVDIVESFRSYEEFAKIQENATEEMWSAYTDAVSRHVAEALQTEHTVLGYIRDIAKTWYGVNHELLYNNNGFYTLNAFTTINQFEAIFAEYRIEKDGAAASEMALGATVEIEGTKYPALVYMVITDDGNSENNATANEVSVHVVFGDKFLDDISNKPVKIYYCSPDGSKYIGHSDMKVSFFANIVESKYRDMYTTGG